MNTEKLKSAISDIAGDFEIVTELQRNPDEPDGTMSWNMLAIDRDHGVWDLGRVVTIGPRKRADGVTE